ncbi:hypothetical protein AVEN_146123-1 [Araneus ventricosus]|uniref:Uncharacterized protein n=1 Tax=Araneus ventricosus TaxID=182803 RepID=A0A4Y2PDV7_ARAVE|nr:hypothetical protein AVEN_146123-1 [Araneus ventricosus]
MREAVQILIFNETTMPAKQTPQKPNEGRKDEVGPAGPSLGPSGVRWHLSETEQGKIQAFIDAGHSDAEIAQNSEQTRGSVAQPQPLDRFRYFFISYGSFCLLDMSSMVACPHYPPFSREIEKTHSMRRNIYKVPQP